MGIHNNNAKEKKMNFTSMINVVFAVMDMMIAKQEWEERMGYKSYADEVYMLELTIDCLKAFDSYNSPSNFAPSSYEPIRTLEMIKNDVIRMFANNTTGDMHDLTCTIFGNALNHDRDLTRA